jgi:hypothetical protein
MYRQSMGVLNRKWEALVWNNEMPYHDLSGHTPPFSQWMLENATLVPPDAGSPGWVVWAVTSDYNASGFDAGNYIGSFYLTGQPAWTLPYIAYSGLAVGDVDGDQRSDLVFARFNDNIWEIRNPSTGRLTDTLVMVPQADLRTGSLFDSSTRDVFFIRDSVLFVWFPFAFKSAGKAFVPAGSPVAAGFPLTAAPNPFNAAVTLSWPETTDATGLEIFDILGRRVIRFEIGAAASQSLVTWDGADDRGRALPSGVYFARLQGSGPRVVRKLVLLK